MRKNFKFSVALFAILAIGVLALACGGGDDKECTGPADCADQGANYYCDLTTNTCKCNPTCTGVCGGDDGCGGTCPDNCTGDQVCSGAPDWVCEGGTTCTNGQTRCDGTVIETCQNNAWVAGTDCASSNQTCADGQCVGGTTCTNGQTRCDGTVIETCQNNAWVPGTDCATGGEICVNGACEATGTCTNGQSRCNGSVIETCQNNAWVPGTDCATSGEICVDGACEDVPTTEECPTGQSCVDLTEGDNFLGCLEGGNIPGTAQSCNPEVGCDGNFICIPVEETAYCVGLCGTCPTGQECEELTDGGMMGCLHGGYIPAGAQEDCSEQSPCIGNAMCYTINQDGDTICIENCSLDGPCANGTSRCDGDIVQTCQGGVWVNGTNCASSGETCYAGACVSGDLCPTGRDCVDITEGDGTGAFACLESDAIPADAPACAAPDYACPGNMSCWNTNDGPLCLENCGTCDAGLDCVDITEGDGSGVHACLENNAIPADAPACAAPDYACPGNMGCWNTNDGTLCLGNCSIPH